MATTWQDIGRRYLEQQLRAKGRDAVMTYGELLAVFPDLPEFTGSWPSHPLCDMFRELDIEDASLGRLFRTAVALSKDDRLPGSRCTCSTATPRLGCDPTSTASRSTSGSCVRSVVSVKLRTIE